MTDSYMNMDLLRFTTAGSVDDGKSTLIGRLLYDTKSLFEDQLEEVNKASVRQGAEHINLALITDGLRAEREQGITIDVAYRYFATPKRKFIIADTPGHIQYTRNMFTGASTANAAIILIDARNRVIEQTQRHTYIASLLRIHHIIVCVNKMDLVNYSEDVFNKIKNDFLSFIHNIYFTFYRLHFTDYEFHFVPICAKFGDNVVEPSKNIPWYKGGTLLNILENIPITNNHNLSEPRFSVQYIIHPQSTQYPDYRGYAGRITSGVFHKGDKILILPSKKTSVIRTIESPVLSNSKASCELHEAFAPMSITITLEDDIDISRGDMIVRQPTDNPPKIDKNITLMLCWFNEKPMKLNTFYALKHTTKDVRCIVKDIKYKVNINTMEKITDDKEIKLNDIACISLKTTAPLVFDSYEKNKWTGSIILIDEATNETVGAGMIE